MTGGGALERRAARLSRLVALLATVLFAAYLMLQFRSVPPAWVRQSRLVGGIAVVVWYWVTYRVAKRIALQWMR